MLSLAPGETNFIGSRPLTQAEADALYFPIDGDLGQADFGMSYSDVQNAINQAIISNQLLAIPEADQRYLGFDADFGVLFQELESQFSNWLSSQQNQIDSIGTGLMEATLQEIENHREESPAHSWGQISEKPDFDAIYRTAGGIDWSEIENIPPLATDWGSILDKPDFFPSATHSSTHHSGGTDAISAEAIGAEVEGTAANEMAAHLAEVNPHPQYSGNDSNGGEGITYNIINSSQAFIEEFDDFLQNGAGGKLGWATGNQNGFSMTVPGNGFPGAKGVFGCGINGSQQAIGDFSRNRLGNFPVIPQISEGYLNMELYGVVGVENINQTDAGWSSRFGLIDGAHSNIDGSNWSVLICAEFFDGAYNWIALWRSGNGITERRLITPVQVSPTEMFRLKIFINCEAFKIFFSVGENQIEVDIPQADWGFGAMAPVFQIQRLGISASTVNRRIWGDKFLIRENVSDQLPPSAGITEVDWADILNKPDFGLIYRQISIPINWTEIEDVPEFTVNWGNLEGKPTAFPPSSHTHPWVEVSEKPETSTRWPSFEEVTGKPSNYPPSTHIHHAEDIDGLYSYLNSYVEWQIAPFYMKSSPSNSISGYFSWGSGWSVYSSISFPVQLWRTGKLIKLNGLISRTTTSGNIIATLSVGFRPPNNRVFTTQGIISGATYTMFRIDINTNGVITIVNPLPASAISWISLDGISFFAA